MCFYCYATLGAIVGGAAIAKAGGLGSTKLAVVGFFSRVGRFKR